MLHPHSQRLPGSERVHGSQVRGRPLLGQREDALGLRIPDGVDLRPGPIVQIWAVQEDCRVVLMCIVPLNRGQY